MVVVSAVLVCLVIVLGVLMLCFSMGKFKVGRPSTAELVEQINSALTEDLNHGAHWWWSWDLLRRFIFLLIYAPLTFYPWWVKRIQGMIFLLVCLYVHIRSWPYSPRNGLGRLSRCRSDHTSCSFVPTKLKDLLFGRFNIKAFLTSNVLETFLLTLLCIVSLLGSVPVESRSLAVVEDRVHILQAIVTATVFFGGIVFIFLLCFGKESQPHPIVHVDSTRNSPNNTNGHHPVNESNNCYAEQWLLGSSYHTFDSPHSE